MDVRKSQSPEPVEGKEDLTAQVLHWARDRTEAFEAGDTASEEKPPRQAKKNAPARVVVIAFQEGTDNCGEAHLFDDLQVAGRFVEALVEGGLDEQRLSVFNCTQLDVELTYRPVVHLKASGAEEEPAV